MCCSMSQWVCETCPHVFDRLFSERTFGWYRGPGRSSAGKCDGRRCHWGVKRLVNGVGIGCGQGKEAAWSLKFAWKMGERQGKGLALKVMRGPMVGPERSLGLWSEDGFARTWPEDHSCVIPVQSLRCVVFRIREAVNEGFACLCVVSFSALAFISGT